MPKNKEVRSTATAKQYELLFQLTARLGPNFSRSFKNASQTMKLLQSDLRSADKKLRDVSAYQKQQNAVEKSRQRVSELQAEHERLTKEIEETGQETPKLTRQLQANEKALQKAQDATAREEEKLGELSNTLREAGVNTDNLGRDTNELRQQYEKLEKAQKKVQEITEKQAANKQAISQTKAQLGGLVGTVAAVGAAIYAGPVKKAAEFQSQMSTVKAIAGSVEEKELPAITKKAAEMGLAYEKGTNATETAMNILAAKAKQMGATTAFTAAEAGEAMEYMAMAGWKTKDMLGGIEGIMNLAAASGEELGSVSDIVTDALTAFGLKASDAGHFSDVLAQASSNANTDVSMMGSTFQKVAPVAGALGYSVEDMSLGIGLMANASIKAEAAGTSLKTALANMAKPTKQQAAYMDKYKISLTRSDGTMKSFGEVVENLRSSLGGLSEQEQVAAATAIFGKESFAGMLAIVNTSEKDFDKLTNAVYNCDGAAKQMAETKLDNLNGSITIAKSAFDALQLELGNLLIPTLNEGVKKFTDIINVVTAFVQKNPEAVKTIAKIAAGLVGLKAGGLIAKLGFLEVKGGILSIQEAFTTIKDLGITKYLSSITGGFLNFRNIFGPLGGVAGKILPIVGVITTVITVVQLVKNHLQEIRGFIQKTFGDEALAVFDKVIAVITNIGNTIKNVFSDGNIGEARNKIQEIFGDKGVKVFNTLVNILGTVRGAVANVIQFVTNNVVPVAEKVLQVVITSVIPGIVSFMQAAAPTIMQIIQSVVDFVGAVIPLIADFIAGLMPVISEIITFLQTYVLPIIGEVFGFITSIVLPAISAAIQAILPVVISVLQTLLPAIQTALTTIWNIVAPIIQGILSVVQAVMPVILSVVQSVIGSISGIIQNLMTILQGIIDFVTGVFTGNWSQAWNGIKTIFKGAVGGLGEIIKAPLRAVVSAVNTVISGLNKLKVPDWVPGIGGKEIKIPPIPGFVNGTMRTPDTFIAGENGPELITGAANRSVFTAAQTGKIFNNMAQAGELNTASNVNVGAVGAGTITIHVTNNPTVNVNGGKTDGIKEQLQQYDEEFLEKIRQMIVSILRELKEQEGRVAYA